MRSKNNGRFAPNRGADEPVEDDSTRWLGTYGDAVTLLMAFFVMLYAMSEVDAQKFEAFVSGLEGPFGNTAVTQTVLPTNSGLVGPLTPQQMFAQPGENFGADIELVPDDSVTEEPSEQPSDAPSLPDEDDEGAVVQVELEPAQLSQLAAVERALEQALAEIGFEGVADFRITTRGLVVSIASDNVLFATGSTEVSDDGYGIVRTLADVLQRYPNDVIVEGHTDDVPLDRPGYSNWNLSTDRAVAVVNQLIDEHGLEPPRLGASGYADQRPRVPNDSPANRALNRRVDVLVVAQGVDPDG